MKNFIANTEKKLDAWGEKLEKINITYPADLVTGILFFVVSVVVLLIMPKQVVISEKDLINGRAFPTMMAYLMLAMSVLLVGGELAKVTDLFVIGALFCAVAFLVFFRCKKKSYYAITIGMAVAIWVVFRFVLNVSF